MKREYLGVRSCTGECHSKGYPFAAIQDAKFCMCSRQFGRYGVADDESECMTECVAGAENEKCGGPWKNAVYAIGELTDKLHSGMNLLVNCRNTNEMKMRPSQLYRNLNNCNFILSHSFHGLMNSIN